MNQIAHNFNHFIMLYGTLFLLAYILIRSIMEKKEEEKKKSCSNGEHKWSRHTIGKHCLKCKITWKMFKEGKQEWD